MIFVEVTKNKMEKYEVGTVVSFCGSEEKCFPLTTQQESWQNFNEIPESEWREASLMYDNLGFVTDVTNDYYIVSLFCSEYAMVKRNEMESNFGIVESVTIKRTSFLPYMTSCDVGNG